MHQNDTPKNSKVRYIEVDRGYGTPCWEWQMFRTEKGYGRLRVDGKYTPAHRHYYEQWYGPIPEGMQLDHLCENTCCVNPDHLEPVTCAENIRRSRVAKLMPQQVDEIRALEGTATASAIAERFGVTRWTVSRIWHGQRWKEDAA